MTNTMTDENTGTSYDLTGDTNFDFGDGNGSVPAHKHMNGGGWVAETASVDASAFVGGRVVMGVLRFDKASVQG